MSEIDATFRQKTIENLDGIIKEVGLLERITAEKLESGIFIKSDCKEKYLAYVSKITSHLRRKDFLTNSYSRNQENMICKDLSHDEKQDEKEKVEKESTPNGTGALKVKQELQNDTNPVDMEFALNKLSLKENERIQTDKGEKLGALSSETPLEKPSEIKISEVYGRVQSSFNVPSPIRIAQVHQAFRPPALHFERSEMRNTVPKILNVTSLNRFQSRQPVRLPIISRPLFDESTRFKYRESLIRRILVTEESVYNKANTMEQYVTFFQNLFVETSNQVNMSREPYFKISNSQSTEETKQNLYQLLNNEPEQTKFLINEEFKALDSQIKSILKDLAHDPKDVSLKEIKILPDEFERGLSVFCAAMTKNHSMPGCTID